ncbi:MAG: hypothetical protein K0Q79_1817 [Flavipsychrobacter sp.]|jgi:hypothetical protein|nr:hypothetical protein [Flavipsychrobacter sp.]
MIRFPALFALLFLFVSSYGQNVNHPVGYVTLGAIPKKFTNGKVDASVVTRAEVLANTTLTMPPPSLEIVEFTFSMLPKGNDFIGPYKVKDARLSNEIITKIQELEDPQGKIFIENIKVSTRDGIRIMSPILLNMVLNK